MVMSALLYVKAARLAVESARGKHD